MYNFYAHAAQTSEVYPCLYVNLSCIWLPFNNLSSSSAIHLKIFTMSGTIKVRPIFYFNMFSILELCHLINCKISIFVSQHQILLTRWKLYLFTRHSFQFNINRKQEHLCQFYGYRFVPVPSQDLHFQHHMSLSFVQ